MRLFLSGDRRCGAKFNTFSDTEPAGEIPMHDVYITRMAKCLPNEPVSNEEMENILGMINGHPSSARNYVLFLNGIKTRYYVRNKQGRITHNNAQLTAEAIKNLIDEHFTLQDIELLCCGTATPDQLVPSHASMVHGILENRPLEIISTTGVCCAGVQAYKYGFLSVKSGNTSNAVCTGSETPSFTMSARHFTKEMEALEALKEQAILPFEKEFLRWMVSDGAGAWLIENKPRAPISLRVEWIDSVSYAHELDVCMYSGCQKGADGIVQHWQSLDYECIQRHSITTLHQDVRLLRKCVIKYAVKSLKRAIEKMNLDLAKVDYFLPHISSESFRKPTQEEMEREGVNVPPDKWFTNLDHVGNTGAASIYLALEELVNSGKLKKGQSIYLAVPESGRFTYMSSLLTVC
jgi:3-oxoacyl-[acyl-carrier-protein] synthase-3